MGSRRMACVPSSKPGPAPHIPTHDGDHGDAEDRAAPAGPPGPGQTTGDYYGRRLRCDWRREVSCHCFYELYDAGEAPSEGGPAHCGEEFLCCMGSNNWECRCSNDQPECDRLQVAGWMQALSCPLGTP
ncbi:MAG: hypothetical protein OXU20_32420 [Myxococcales bacterium]|nr:hypothetical protein [Myxococcales bacterium]